MLLKIISWKKRVGELESTECPVQSACFVGDRFLKYTELSTEV